MRITQKRLNTKENRFDDEFSIASATTTDLGTTYSENIYITGTTTITGLGTVAAGAVRRCRFADALTLTHNATSLILPTAANIITAANDCAEALSLGSGNWIFRAYTTASGYALKDYLTPGTVTATTSGTTHDYAAIPSWVKRITCMLSGVSLSGASNLLIRIGDSGGIEATGYSSSTSVIANTYDTSGFMLVASMGTTSANETASGIVTLTLIDPASNTWVCSGTISVDNSGVVIGTAVLAGKKGLTAPLDRVRLLTTTSFDAGQFNIFYE